MLEGGEKYETKGKQGQGHKKEPGMYLIWKVHTVKCMYFLWAGPIFDSKVSRRQ